MNHRNVIIFLVAVITGVTCLAQPPQPGGLGMRGAAPVQASQPAVKEDFKPSTLNLPGQQYPMVNSEGRVRLRIVAPNAQSITVVSQNASMIINTTQMTKDEDGVWTGTSVPLDEGCHFYHLSIDGVEVSDPGTLTFYETLRMESVVEIPAKDQDFYALKDVPHGKVVQILFPSKSTNTSRRAFVYQPPDYDKDQSKRYPVLYLQHGWSQDETAWSNQGHANLIMDNLLAEGKCKPFLIVMTYGMTNEGMMGMRRGGAGGRGGATGERRGGTRAQGVTPGGTPVVPTAAAPGGAAGRGGMAGVRAGGMMGGARAGAGGTGSRRGGGMMGGMGNGFETVLVDELIPYVDANFRTIADQAHRAMAGLSMGGMETRQITLARPDTFSYYGLFSGGTYSPTDLADHKSHLKLVFMSCGSRENPDSVKNAADTLNQAGFKAVFYISQDTAHEFQSWRRSFHEFAPLLFTDIPLASPAPAATASSSVDASRKLKNAPIPSAGSDKELGDFKSGIYTMESAGLTRQYTIDIPENYDKNTPYRLIFAMHMMGGHMNTMVSGNYYELKTYAKRDNIPVIFVAPEGYTDQSPWRGRDDKDHIFFADMLKLFKDKLSIDTSRIFCCGFSFGAMVSYSLSLDFQDDLRAVACYAPANWNIYLPENKHKPIAYFSTTGTQDNLCRYVNSDEQKQGGKYCVLTHIEDNGLKELPEIPIATTRTHVTTEFKGLPEEYPVVFGSFVGGHSNNEKDPGSNVNWIAKETWDFFVRF
jgi:enterochelin esterase-like enzyme/poly(3-hydroxybutyrate) depolymerase